MVIDMIKTFIQERAEKYDELLQINTENGAVKIYSVEKEIGFPFSEYETNSKDMGYDSVDDMIKNMKITAKEIDTKSQIEKEINGLLNLAKHRADNNKHVYITLKDGTKYNDIVERLKKYGIEEKEAVKMIYEKIA